MKNILSTICFCLISIIAFSQVWTEPVNISNMHAFIQSSDFCIDNSGVFHCVWNKKIDDNHSVLYYSKSDDEGITWSDPENISQNDNRYYMNPKILADSDDNLFVAFDNYDFSFTNWSHYPSVLIYHDNIWSETIDLGIGFGVRVAIDCQDRYYVFWFEGAPHNGQFCYRYFENDTWSDYFTPFNTDTTLTSVSNLVIDNERNIHCVGQYDPFGNVTRYPYYIKYDFKNQEWNDMKILSSVYSKTSDIDIIIDNYENPHVTWDEDKTVYSFFNDNIWSDKQIVNNNPSSTVQIGVDSLNNPIIVTTESHDDEVRLQCYANITLNGWCPYNIDISSNTIFTPKLILQNEIGYLIYQKSSSPYDADLYISQTDLTLLINDFISNKEIISSAPNPFYTNVKFSIVETKIDRYSSFRTMCVYDISGKIIKKFNSCDFQNNSLVWNGMDEDGKSTKPGVYIVVFQFGEHTSYIKLIKTS